jgi:molybdopterin molybdotransferase
MMATLARADGLIIRAPHVPAAKAGESVEVIPFGESAVTI